MKFLPSAPKTSYRSRRKIGIVEENVDFPSKSEFLGKSIIKLGTVDNEKDVLYVPMVFIDFMDTDDRKL